jgi:hypothetical protein
LFILSLDDYDVLGYDCYHTKFRLNSRRADREEMFYTLDIQKHAYDIDDLRQ